MYIIEKLVRKVIQVKHLSLLEINVISIISGESRLAGTRDRESEHGGANASHVRRSTAANLHPDAPGLLPSFCQQRDF